MSFQQRNISVSLVTFILILGLYLIRVFQLLQSDGFTSTNIFRLWGITIILSIVATIVLSILAHIGSAVFQVIKTGDENPKIEDIQDERDKLIDLRGTRVTYLASS